MVKGGEGNKNKNILRAEADKKCIDIISQTWENSKSVVDILRKTKRKYVVENKKRRRKYYMTIVFRQRNQ